MNFDREYNWTFRVYVQERPWWEKTILRTA